jgi:hypothetical protein
MVLHKIKNGITLGVTPFYVNFWCFTVEIIQQHFNSPSADGGTRTHTPRGTRS